MRRQNVLSDLLNYKEEARDWLVDPLATNFKYPVHTGILENRCQFQIRNGAKNINVKIWYKKEKNRLLRTQSKQIKFRLLPVVAV